MPKVNFCLVFKPEIYVILGGITLFSLDLNFERMY
jgi:hypothetical protein